MSSTADVPVGKDRVDRVKLPGPAVSPNITKIASDLGNKFHHKWKNQNCSPMHHHNLDPGGVSSSLDARDVECEGELVRGCEQLRRFTCSACDRGGCAVSSGSRLARLL